MKSSSLIFFGTEEFSLYSLRSLVGQGWNIETVITKPGGRGGRGKSEIIAPIKKFALENHIPILQPSTKEALLNDISAIKADIAVLSSYGMMVPKSVINHFTQGIVNIHPSLLPKYRGPSPIEATILSGEATAGVTLMKLNESMDAGPIYQQEQIALKGNETKASLQETLGELGAKLLIDTLAEIISGELQPTDQNDEMATYCHLITKSDGKIDWNKPANQIEREVRAYIGWPGSYTKINDIDVIITKAQALTSTKTNAKPGSVTVDLHKNELLISTTDGILSVQNLKPSGRKEITAVDFINGYFKK